MSDNPVVCSPPSLPQYLKGIYDLKPIVGAPSDDELMGIHAVMRVAQKAVEIPGTGDPVLLVKLAEHLFDAQMAKYRIKYLTTTFPENTTYIPPSLPLHLTAQLEPVIDAPSEEEIIKVQDAIRTYGQLVNVPSMFDPRVNMELSQHLFDIQMAKYTQRARHNHASPVSLGTHSSSPTATVERTFDKAQEGLITNNPGTGANVTFDSSQSVQSVSDSAIRECIQTSNRLAEQANQLAERSNLLIERSNQLAERANQLVEKSNQPAEQSSKPAERFAELFERMNEHFEQSNRLVESSTKPVENLGDVLKNINKVLVGIQHAIVRSRKDNTVMAVDCLINEKGDTPGQSRETGYASFGRLSLHFGDSPGCNLSVAIGGTAHTLHIDDTWLGRFLRFYGACPSYCEDGTSTGLKAGCENDARRLFGRYLSTCLG